MLVVKIRTWDRGVGIFLMLLAVFIYAYTYSFDYPKGQGYMVDIAFFPRFLAIVLFILGSLLFLKTPAGEQERSSIKKEAKLVSVYVATILYTYLLNKIGFLPDTFLWVLFITWFAGERKWWVLLLTATLGPGLGYFLFGHLLRVPLPEGRLLEFLGMG